MLTVKLGADPRDTVIETRDGVDITDELGVKMVRIEAYAGKPNTVIFECFADKIDLEKIQTHVEVITHPDQRECNHLMQYTMGNAQSKCVHCGFEEQLIDPSDDGPEFFVGEDEVERFVVTNENPDNYQDVLYYGGILTNGPLWVMDANRAVLMKTMEEADAVFRELPELENRRPGILRVSMPKDVVYCRCEPAPDTHAVQGQITCLGCGRERECQNA